MFLCVMLSLTPERAPKAGPATCLGIIEVILLQKQYIAYLRDHMSNRTTYETFNGLETLSSPV